LFRYPVYFVHRVLSEWDALRDGATPPVEDFAHKFGEGRNCWTVQTYMRLRERGRDVDLVPDYVPGQINVVHYDDLTIRHRPDRAFIVAFEPDRPRPAIADMRIVQNHLQIRCSRDHFMPLWPQPGLRARDSSRAATLQRIGYVGIAAYLAAEFQSENFRRRLAEMGMELVIRDRDFTNYTDLDAVLAVRKVSPFDLSIKPASKLINAWLAGCPALLGIEPAYQNLRRSDLDFIEIATADEAIAALRKLKEEPGLYEKRIEHGKLRAQEYTTQKLCERWEGLFAGPVMDGYERWKHSSGVMRLMRFAARSIQHKRERRRFFRLIKT
jgi:hypothetical protein